MEPITLNLPSGRGLMVPTSQLAISQTDTAINFQGGIDVPVTELVVGQPRPTAYLGEQLFRPVGVGAIRFQWQKYGLERFAEKEAKRAMLADFQHSTMRADMESDLLERYGWASLLDRDELANADAAQSILGLALNIREKHQRLARDIVDISVEADRAAVAIAAASYSQSSPDLDVTLGAGSEWNHSTGGDSFASIWAVAELLAGVHGLAVENLEVFLTNASLRAAFQDPTFRAARATGGRTTVPTRDELRQYWGVSQVIVGDAYKLDSAGTGIESLYGDVAIIRPARVLSGFETSEGSLDSFVRFYWRQFGAAGKAMVAQNVNFPKTVIAFPFEHWERQRTVNTKAAAIIRNTHT